MKVSPETTAWFHTKSTSPFATAVADVRFGMVSKVAKAFGTAKTTAVRIIIENVG